MEKIRIVQVGIGPLGQKSVRYMYERTNIEIVAAVDKDPQKVGKDLGEICGLSSLNVQVVDSFEKAISGLTPDAAVLTTVSDMERIVPQVEEIVSHGIPVVSTCEELSYPWDTCPELAEKLDTLGKEKNVAILGTGINPGYLMDSLPIFLTSVCQKVERVKVSRIQNAEFRRVPFQKKIGSGLTLEQFEEKKKEGTLRHVGLTESVQQIAGALGWKLEKVEDILTPVVAEAEITGGAFPIQKGMACGVQQIGKGCMNGEEVITLIFRAAVGQKNPEDTVEISGEPDINSTIKNGVNGDVATCAITINAIKQLLNARPGLRTMSDMPLVSYFN